jgi:hypothetical protein
MSLASQVLLLAQRIATEFKSVRTSISTRAAKTTLLVAAYDAPTDIKNAADYVCDGVNDQVEINAALLLSNVKLSSGTFYTTGPVKLVRNRELAGSSIYATTVRPANSATWTAVDGSYGAVMETYDSAAEHVVLRQLTIDGGMYDNCNLRGILLYNNLNTNATDSVHVIEDVYVRYCNRDAITYSGNFSRGNVFNNLTAISCGLTAGSAVGILCAGTDSTITNCSGGDCTSDAIKVVGANNRFVSCKGWYSDGNGINIVSGAERNIFTACEAQDNLKHGFDINGSTTLSACIADSNSYDQSPSTAITGRTYSGFHIAAYQVNLQGYALDKNEGSRGIRQVYSVMMETWVKGVVVNVTSTQGYYTGLVNSGWDSTNVVQVIGDNTFVNKTAYATPTASSDPATKSYVDGGAGMISGSTITINKSGSTWPGVPTTRTDIVVIWAGADPSPPPVSFRTLGSPGLLDNVDYRVVI